MMNIEQTVHELMADAQHWIEEARDALTAKYPVDDEFGKYCDHTVLRAYTPKSIVKRFCEEGIAGKAASICVNPVHVAYVHSLLKGTGVKTCCVIGFPLGANRPEVKALEARLAIQDGAVELDMVINVGALRDGDLTAVYEDIKAVTRSAKGKAIVKVIIETCYLTDMQKIQACVISELAGADFVKTSSGFGTGGATEYDVRLMKRVVGNRLQVKASTGIEKREDVVAMVEAGATRMGTSRLVQIVSNDPSAFCASKDNQPPKFD